MEHTEKNMEKYGIYKTMYENLSKAMRAGFYYEAIFIEYAILEDRLTALLAYAGVPHADKNGREDKISRKIAKARDRPEFSTKFVRDRIPVSMMDALRDWTDKRNALIHNLANIPYDGEAVRAIAEEGEQLLKTFKNKAASVMNRFKKYGSAT